MEETTVSIIGIMIAAVLMFIVPLTLIADRSDDISQLVTQTVTAEFVDEIIKTGKITADDYQNFILSLNTTGNTYEIDMEVKILDENTAKPKTLDSGNIEIGNNRQYSIFTSQIEDKLWNDGRILLKQGDAISVTVKNSSQTLSQSLKSFFYNITGTNMQIIAATASGTIVVDGAIY